MGDDVGHVVGGRSPSRSVADLDQGDAIDAAAGQHQVSVRSRHHVADDASTRWDQPRLKLFSFRVETYERTTE